MLTRLLVIAALAALWMAAPGAAGRYTPYDAVRPILTAVAAALPPALEQGRSRAAWEQWSAEHDRRIRERLARGDLDTLVHWLLLGTTFTARPRAVVDAPEGDLLHLPPLVTERARDLVLALERPGTDERRLFARRLLTARGQAFDGAPSRERAVDFLVAEVARVTREQGRYARELAETRTHGDATAAFAAQSRLYRERGLSTDTSFLPNFAVERALADLLSRGVLRVGQVRDVAVIGPGLDFSDKSSGYDFYPPQMLQPFSLVDSLLRLGLAPRAAAVHVTTLDVSPRVNDHLISLRRRANQGVAYRIRLPLDPAVAWTPELLRYWRTTGDRISTSVAGPGSATVAGRPLRVRTLTVDPVVALRVAPEDVNIVVERLADRQFDLVVATNIFVYYDLLDQILALANVEAMLRRGGVLLSNNALLELPGSPMRSVASLAVPYSDRRDDGDRIVTYQAIAPRP